MANFELRFLCGSFDGSFITAKTVIYDEYSAIDIVITDENGSKHSVCFDKSTAIKFSKTLRTEINKITESEVDNG